MTRRRADDSLLEEQVAYYRARAVEYDEWFARSGRYDRGEDHRRAWRQEIGTVETALASQAPLGRCLELACGTGLWTRHLLTLADEVTALDASPEVLAINARRNTSAKLRLIEADLFDWHPRCHYDFVFFSFWLSHVPADRFEAFWRKVGEALAPGERAFLVDSLYEPESAAVDHAAPAQDGIVERKLNDGRRFRVVKLFYDPEELTSRLAALGWRADLRASGRFFLFGSVRPEPE